VRGEWGDDGDEEGENIAEHNAKQAAENRKNKGFEDELDEDIITGSADGFADADFVGAFRNGNKHNIHYTNTANDKRNASDKSKHTGNNGEKGRGRVGDVVSVSDGEISVAGFVFDKFFANFVRGLFKSAGSFGLDVDLLDLDWTDSVFESS